MKIYYAINGRLPTEKANGYQVSQMCQAFLENRCEVSLLRPQKTLSSSLQKYQNDLKSFYNLRLDIKVIDVWSFDFQDFFHRRVRFLDKFQFIFNLLHTITYVFGLAYFFFKRERRQDELFYLRDINILSWIYLLLDSELQKKIVLELHYLPEEIWKRKRYLKILKRAHLVVAITYRMKKDLIDLGLLQEKVIVEHDGVDLEQFSNSLTMAEARAKFNLPEASMIIGYVGNFHTNGQEKGIEDVIKAARTVLKKHPETVFCFIGGPMDRVPRYKNLVQQLGLPENQFLFRDRVPVSQVPEAMAACDVLTIPLPWNPYFAFYMSPMKLFEYMASNRCIVATNVESLCEILKNDETALLAQHSNPQALADEYNKAIESHELRLQLAARAKKEVEYFQWKLRAGRILKYLRIENVESAK